MEDRLGRRQDPALNIVLGGASLHTASTVPPTPVAGDPQSPWPQRQRPLCPYPRYARYKGHGSPDDAASFACVSPDAKVR